MLHPLLPHDVQTAHLGSLGRTHELLFYIVSCGPPVSAESVRNALNGDSPASFAATLGSVPEPGTLGLIGAGIGLLLTRRRVGQITAG